MSFFYWEANSTVFSFNSEHWFTDGSVVILLRIVPEKQIQFRSWLSQLQFNLQRLCLFHPANKWPAAWGGLLGFISLPRHRVSWVSLRCPVSTGVSIFQCWTSCSNEVSNFSNSINVTKGICKSVVRSKIDLCC